MCMAIYDTIEVMEGEDGEKKEALILTITSGHKETIEKLVRAYAIKDGDPAKLIAFLIDVASEKSVIGRPLGTTGNFFSLPREWVVSTSSG